MTTSRTDDNEGKNDNDSPRLTIHDALALGEYEAAVIPNNHGDDGTAAAEVHCLPLLLRLLSASRPLASLPDFQDLSVAQVVEKKEEQEKDKEEKDDATANKEEEEGEDASAHNNVDEEDKDAWLDAVVQRLEDRAALYSAAEGLEVLAGHLAPHVCKKWSKLAPPHRTANGDHAVYDTTALEQAARTAGKRRKMSETSLGAFSSADEGGNVLDDYNRVDAAYDNNYEDADQSGPDDYYYDEEEREDTSTASGAQQRARKRRKPNARKSTSSTASLFSQPPPASLVVRRQSTATLAVEREFAAEDSQQAVATKSWTELALLVTQSLQQPLTQKSQLCLTVDEASILAQSQSAASGASTMGSADLSATLAAMLHHTPVLRYDQVATALCRVGLSQAIDVCARLGANAPATVPALVHGCAVVALCAAAAASTVNSTATSADHPAHDGDDHPATHGNSGGGGSAEADDDTTQEAAMNTAAKSIQALAALSPYQAARTATQWRLMSSSTAVTTGPPSSTSRLGLALAVKQENALAIALWVDQHLTLPQLPLTAAAAAAEKKDSVVVQALTYLAQDIKTTTASTGRLQWTLVAYIRLLATHKAGPHISFDWVEALASQSSFYPTLVVIAWLGFAQCRASTTKQGRANVKACRDILQKLLHEESSSHAIFNCHVVTNWKAAQSERFGELLLHVMERPVKDLSAEVAEWLASCNSLVESCAELVEGFDLKAMCNTAMTASAVLDDLDSAAKCLGDPLGLEFFEEGTVRKTLGGVLDSSYARTLVTKSGTLPFLVSANSFLTHVNMKKQGLPVVMPLQLEKMGLEAQDEIQQVAPEISPQVACLLLNLVYALCFLKEQPESPFAPNLRNLPVIEIYAALQSMPSGRIDEALLEHLLSGIPKACQEVVMQSQMPCVFQRAIQAKKPDISASKWKRDFSKAVREVLKDPAKDPSGEMIEATFCRGFGMVPQETLCCTLASAVLSVRFPLTVFPYPRLCMDPLTFLKCPISCWDQPGFRRVLLTVLSFLLRINDALIQSSAEDREEASEEYIVARNVLLVRCIMALMEKCASLRCCLMTTGVLRNAISQCPGIGAVLLRQGMSDAEIDWLISNVPEILGDGNAYHDLLALQTIPTTSDRLVAASSILWISIIHGHRDDVQAQALALAAITQLIANFFIVIGPVGVPVQAFVGEHKGTDSTQICRRAALRMIKSMCHVRLHRQALRNECVLALHKLARLCKGEEIVGGLPAAAANRQKAFVREMLDSINKAMISMGSGL